jgi:hypothetical protein
MARSRYRSVAYDLEASIEVARVVAQSGGKTDTVTLASSLSYSGVRNGAFLSRLANARLFGLVTGRVGEVVLTERGRRCLSVDPRDSRLARAEACLAVPLFHRVMSEYSGRPLPALPELTGILREDFGEAATKAPSTARTLVDSAAQAGLLAASGVMSQVNPLITDFTDFDTAPRPGVAPSVGLTTRPSFPWLHGRRRGRTAGGERVMGDERRARDPRVGEPDGEGLWLNDGTSPPAHRKLSPHVGITLGVAACLVVIGIPVGILVSAHSWPKPPAVTYGDPAVHLGHGVAERSVLAALSATTDSGNFSFTYDLSQSPGTSTQTPAPSCPADPAGSVPACDPHASATTVVQGSGTINTNPMAMAASALFTNNGQSGLQVGVRVDPTTVWEVSSTDNGLTSQATGSGGGQSLPDFAGITEGTLGDREGAVAMMGMASPTGYLDLVQPAISGAAEVGASTVDGVAVTQYELAIAASSLSTAPNVSSEEASTINSAVALLTQQGYTNIRDLISVDASGFIRESSSTVSFSDGGTVTLDAHFSAFGCAGTVLMPGTNGVSTVPANCSSPDTGVVPATGTTTTTTTPDTSTTTTTTGAPASATTTTTTGPVVQVTPIMPTSDPATTEPSGWVARSPNG